MRYWVPWLALPGLLFLLLGFNGIRNGAPTLGWTLVVLGLVLEVISCVVAVRRNGRRLDEVTKDSEDEG
jgi:uncharacterized membrane protein YtjA (UPF0391 family)